jgi:homopolymeric O-antigen transport system ATP-binding protein
MSEASSISLRGVSKAYKLYGSALEAALDAVGLGRLLYWRKPPRDFTALRNVDLDIATGSRLGIIGRNGAGKSTLLKLIAGALEPTRGEVKVFGKISAMMTTGLGFHPEYTGYENIRASLIYNDLSRGAYEDAVADVVAFCQLGDFLHQPMKTYSAGMQARLAFATSTAIKPDILIIDEVLGAGDAYFAARSAERMRRLTSGGCTVLLVSHGMQQILQHCDSAIWLEAGEIVARGPTLQVVKQYEEFVRRLEREHLPFDNREINDFLRGRIEAVREAQLTQRNNAIGDAVSVGLPETGIDAKAPAAPAAPLGVTEGGISRWAADGGLRIAELEFRNDVEKCYVFHTGEPFEAVFRVLCEQEGEYACCYNLVFFTESGTLVGRLHSQPDHFRGHAGLVREARVRMGTMQLGHGDYLISAALFDDTPVTLLNEAKCYDLLSRSFRIKVVANQLVDPGTVRLIAEWHLEAAAAKTRGRASAKR